MINKITDNSYLNDAFCCINNNLNKYLSMNNPSSHNMTLNDKLIH